MIRKIFVSWLIFGCLFSSSDAQFNVRMIQADNFGDNKFPIRFSLYLANNKTIRIVVNKYSSAIFDFISCNGLWSQMVCFNIKEIRLDASFFVVDLDGSRFLLFDYNNYSAFSQETCDGSLHEINAIKVFKVNYKHSYYEPSYVYLFNKQHIGGNNEENVFINCFYKENSDDSFLRRKIIGLNTPISSYMTGCKKLLASFIKENARQITLQ